MFKIGDVVECTNDDGMGVTLVAGGTYTLTHGTREGWAVINGYTYAQSRFKLHKEKQMKLKDIIKPFMRVRTRSEGMWIAVEKDGECFLVRDGKYIFIKESGEYGLDGQPEFDTVEVFEAPRHVAHYLDPVAHGKSIWVLQAPKSPQQIAIEELEQSIKVSQDKLEELKRTL